MESRNGKINAILSNFDHLNCNYTSVQLQDKRIIAKWIIFRMFGLLFNHGKVCNSFLNSNKHKITLSKIFILHKRRFKIQKPYKSQ